ncbi:brain tumor protein-like isoform X2 [Liolophura sinensis]|uniref:brain tumor protein-like isoform X2 n=1 Tax=Liolophura sinensis TaxID=3198878 RepID=UPI003157FD67
MEEDSAIGNNVQSDGEGSSLGSSGAGSPCTSPTPVNPEHQCSICSERFKQPKVLTCLHAFCLLCLEKLVQELAQESDGPQPEIIICPICKQETKVPPKGVCDLASDFVMLDLLDMSAIDDMQIVCTSCKAKEKAVARCSDCANFLCPNCVTAHQYMRCFENHKVVSFEDMRNGEVAIHKPIFCDSHPSENLKMYCVTCQVPICSECVVEDHKPPSHQHERIVDLEPKQMEDLNNLISESKGKIKFCEDASRNLENALSDLQTHRDDAKALIQETFQSYKAIVEKRKDDLLQELEKIHSDRELAIMDMFHNVDKTIEKIEDGSKFTERILKHGSGLQILLLKGLISTQLLSLINNTPRPDVNTTIEFYTDTARFEEAVKKNFGSFTKEDDHKVETQTSSLQSSFENEVFTLPPVMGVDGSVIPPVSAPDFLPQIHSLTPMSLPSVTLPSPEMPGMMPMTSLPRSLPTPVIGSHSIPDTSLSRNSQSPAMSDSGISVDAASNSSNSNAPLLSISALAKMGSINFNSQGQVTVNGQVIPGLNISNVTGALPSGRITPAPISPPESSMSSLLSTPTPRSETPSLETLAGLLNQQPPGGLTNGLGGMGNIGTLGNLTSLTGGIGSMMPSPTDSGASNAFQGQTTGSFVRRSGKMSAMQIRCKFGQLGPGKGQFNSPHGFCLGLEEDIIVADTNNHRIQVFEKTGEFKYQFGIPGREEGQLWYPRKVAVMRTSGKYVVCDRGNERSRMQIFTKNGHFIKKIAIRYIDIVAGLAITQQGHIVAVDSVSPTVFCIAETGDLLKWFDCSDYMREPSDIAISGREYFVCDFKGHCVVVFNEDGQFVRRIGCENVTNYPNGIDISDAGDVLVGDSHGNRFHVAVFQRDGSLIGEFECPYVKVSRCCGLKITSEGYVVTLAKNNHHVLVLNTLYIT